MIKPMAPPPEPTAGLLRFCLVLSGIAGAVGIVTLALSAHSGISASLETAAQMLLFHAPVFLGIGVLSQIRQVLILPYTTLSMATGLTLFCGDLITNALLGDGLFPMAAPIGGMLLIVSWIALALGALRVVPRQS